MGLADELELLCRLCLKNVEPMEDIFDNSDGSALVLRIMACVSLEVHKTDNLPKKICAPCRYQLEKTYIFRSKCRENDTRLKRHVKLLAAGKTSTMLEELEEDEDEFGPSLQFINNIDKVKEQQQKEKLKMTIAAHEAKLRAELLEQHKQDLQKAMQQYVNERRRNMVDTEVETCNLSSTSHMLSARIDNCEDEYVEIESSTTGKKLKRKCVSFSEKTEIVHPEPSESQTELADIEYESVEVLQEDQEQSEYGLVNTEDSSINKDSDQKINKQEDEMLDYMDQEVLMEVDDIDDAEVVGSSASIVKPSHDSSRNSADINESLTDSERFVITEVSDSEGYLLDEEERKLYELTDDSDEDLEAVTNAVKAELAEQPGFNVGEHCIMKVEKNHDLTKVEVRAKDGSVICMEFSTEPKKKKKGSDSLAALRAKLAGEFKCHHCRAVRTTPLLLQEHVQSAHPDQNKGVVCDVCAKWCPNKYSLERHYRTHTGEKPFLCGECGRGFVQKEILKRHMLVHTNEKPFFCELCPKRYNQKDQLKNHMNKSHIANPVVTIHKCRLCQKEFKYASGLSRHLSSHYGRTHSCECGKSFTDKSALKRHQRDIHGKKDKDKESSSAEPQPVG